MRVQGIVNLITLTVDGLLPQSSQESLLLVPPIRVLREEAALAGGRLELLLDNEGAGGA